MMLDSLVPLLAFVLGVVLGWLGMRHILRTVAARRDLAARRDTWTVRQTQRAEVADRLRAIERQCVEDADRFRRQNPRPIDPK